jgi:hypothetical protein
MGFPVTLLANPCRFRGVPMVQLLVGKSETSFQVHEDFLCSASPVFHAAFNNDFKEANERKLSLPDDDVETIEYFIQWIYSQPYNRYPVDVSDESYPQLGRLYVFADKMQADGLKKDIVLQFLQLQRQAGVQPPPMSTVVFVFENTTKGSAFRWLLAEYYAWCMGGEWYQKSMNPGVLSEVPEFSADLAVALAQRCVNPTRRCPFEDDHIACEILEAEKKRSGLRVSFR